MGPKSGVKRGKYKSHKLTSMQDYICADCNKKYIKRSSIIQHFVTKHLNQKVQCHCGKKFSSNSVMKRHQKSHLSTEHREIQAISNTEECVENQNQTSLDLDERENWQSSADRHEHTQSDAAAQSIEDSDEDFPLFSKFLSLQESPLYGTHVIAKKDIGAGKIIYVSSPFATVECVESIGSNCFECGKPQNKDFDCHHCINICFCSRKCSKSINHKLMCDSNFHRGDCYIVRLAVKIIKFAFSLLKDEVVQFTQAVLLGQKDYTACEQPFLAYGELLMLKGYTHSDHLTLVQRAVKCLMKINLPSIKNTPKHILSTMASRHIATIKINSFSEEFPICQGKVSRVSLHGLISRINHSCMPNVEHYFDDNNFIRCETKRPIKKGDQIFISYLSAMQFENTISGREYIEKLWHFTCQCDMCCQKDSGHDNDKNSPSVKHADNLVYNF